jgi:hypothetical protein
VFTLALLGRNALPGLQHDPGGLMGHLTSRWSGRVRDKVPSSYVGARAAQLSR